MNFKTRKNWLRVVSKQALRIGFLFFFAISQESFGQIYYSPHEEFDTTTVAFSPNGDYILSAGFDGEIRLWRKDSCEMQGIALIHDPHIPPELQYEFPAYLSLERGILSLAWSPDGKKFVIGMRDQSVRLYSINPKPDDNLLFDEHVVFRDDYQLTVRAVAYSPDGRFIASGGHGSHIFLWDSETKGSSARRFCCHNPGTRRFGVNALDFSSDGKLLVSGSSDGTVKVWDTSTGNLLKTFDVNYEIYSVKFSPDNKLIAGSSYSGEENIIYLWDAKTGVEERRLHHPEGSWSISFNPNGGFLASGGFLDGKILIWDLSSGKSVQTFRDPNLRQIRSLSYSPNGDYIVSGVTYGPLPLWAVQTGKIVRGFGKCPEN